MNALLLRNLGGMRRVTSLQSFSDYRKSEKENPQLSSVTSEGTLLEYETLELRIHPPNVVIEDVLDDTTMVTIDSANRPGTLIEVVQCLTELGLSIRRARISSDGGWFVDEFYVSDVDRANRFSRVQDPRKLGVIKQVLNVDTEANYNNPRDAAVTVFELAGLDRHGLLAAVLQLLVVNGCEVLSAAVWTYMDRVALVISATEKGVPLSDPLKVDRLEQILYDMLGAEDAVVHSEAVRGDIHHERRLHHLLMTEELKSWEIQSGTGSGLALEAAVTAAAATQQQQQAQAQAQGAHPLTSSGLLTAGGEDLALGSPSMGLSGMGMDVSSTPFGACSSTAAGTSSGLQHSHGDSNNHHHTANGSVVLLLPLTATERSSSHASELQSPSRALTPTRGPSSSGMWPSNAHVGAFKRTVSELSAPGDMVGGGGLGGGGLGALQLDVSQVDAASMVLPSVAGGGDSSHGAMAALAALAAGPLGPAGEPVGSNLPVSPRMLNSSNSCGALNVHGSGTGNASSSTNSAMGEQAGSVGVASRQAPGSASASRQTSGGVGLVVTSGLVATGLSPLASPSGMQPAPTSIPTPSPREGGHLDADQLSSFRQAVVDITDSKHLRYWIVSITCRDRRKLFFDTVCTLADMNYDIYHATIDSEGDVANQLFYVRPRYGECSWDPRRADKLKYMLQASVSRRFPKGLKVHVQCGERSCLAHLFSALSINGFWITRADVRTLSDRSAFEFTLTDAQGAIPDHAAVQRICESVGGVLYQQQQAEAQQAPGKQGVRLGASTPSGSAAPNTPRSNLATSNGPGFRFSILERKWLSKWASSTAGSAAGGNVHSGSGGSELDG